MSHLHCYMIALAEDTEDAKSNVRGFIDDYYAREFYDYGGLEEGEEVVLLSEIRESLEATKAKETADRLAEIENEIKNWKAMDNRSMLGFSYVRYGKVLQESFCQDMPLFNIDNWDWSLPTKVPEEANNCNWYAVRADLHY